MADSIFVRVQRVVSGGVESAIDVAEQWSSTSLARQALREMDAALAKAGDEADDALMRRLQAEHQLAAQRKQLAKLKEQARFALDQSREDLAEAAVGRQIDVERQIERLTGVEAEAGAEERKLLETLAALKLRKAEMEEQFAALQAAQRSASADPEAPRSTKARAERKAERAEQAFDRAIAAAGGITGERPSPAVAAKVAEIEALQKEAQVAERLAALRAAAAAPAPVSKAASKARRSRA